MRGTINLTTGTGRSFEPEVCCHHIPKKSERNCSKSKPIESR